MSTCTRVLACPCCWQFPGKHTDICGSQLGRSRDTLVSKSSRGEEEHQPAGLEGLQQLNRSVCLLGKLHITIPWKSFVTSNQTKPEMLCYWTRQSDSSGCSLGWCTQAYGVKNAHHRVPKSEVTSLISFFHPTNSPNLEDSSLTDMKEKEMQQILKFKELETANDRHFCWWNNQNNLLIITIDGNWFSFEWLVD